jgi:hypothetical protein
MKSFWRPPELVEEHFLKFTVYNLLHLRISMKKEEKYRMYRENDVYLSKLERRLHYCMQTPGIGIARNAEHVAIPLGEYF